MKKYDADGRRITQPKQQKLQTLRLRLNIAANDYERTITKAKEFLEARKQVRFTVMLRGREKASPQKGVDMLNRVATDLRDYGSLSKQPTSRNLNVVFNPRKK